MSSDSFGARLIINFSPTGFRLVAQDCLDCYDAYKPTRFSILPFFLCCRAMELAMKASILETRTQAYVKDKLGHNLEKMYDELPSDKQLLTRSEIKLLKKANLIYRTKHFEYMQPGDAGEAFTRFPSNEDLALGKASHGPLRYRSGWLDRHRNIPIQSPWYHGHHQSRSEQGSEDRRPGSGERGQAPQAHVQIKPSVPNRFALCALGRGRLANHADRERVEA